MNEYDFTACTNPGCEHRPGCYRAQLHDRHPETGIKAYFTRDKSLERSRGFDCLWPAKEMKQ